MPIFQTIGDFLSNMVRLGGEALPFSWGTLILRFAVPLIAYIIVYKIIMLLVKRITSRSKLKDDARKKVVLWFRRVLIIVLILLAGILAGLLFGEKFSIYLKMVFSFLTRPFFASGNTKISVITIILAIPIFFIASWIAKLVRGVLDRGVLDRLGIDNAKKYTISNLFRYIVFVLMFLIGLSIIGINLSSLAVIFGVLGVGLGFGLQKVVSNLFAGFVIVLTRPIKEGDRINVLETEGNVIKVRAVSTVINTIKNETIIVPNSLLTEDIVYNYSHDDDPSIILDNSVEIAYSADLEKALVVLKDLGTRNPYGIEGREPVPRVASFENSGIKLILFTWIKDANEKWAARSWTNLEIWRAFRKNGIEIPFPQVDLHFRNSMPGPEGNGPAPLNKDDEEE